MYNSSSMITQFIYFLLCFSLLFQSKYYFPLWLASQALFHSYLQVLLNKNSSGNWLLDKKEYYITKYYLVQSGSDSLKMVSLFAGQLLTQCYYWQCGRSGSNNKSSKVIVMIMCS